MIPPESESIIIGKVHLPQFGAPAVLDGCDDELPSGILVGSYHVNMEDKVPVRVLNVQNKSVHLLEGAHLGKLIEATTEIKQGGNSERKDAKILGGHYSVNSSTDMPSHLVDLIGNFSKGMKMQCQSLTELLCRYEDVFSREEYDLGTFTAIKHQIDTGNTKQIRQSARRTPIAFQLEEVEYLQKQLDA